MNKTWHEKHPMPENPTMEQRIVWQIAHAHECACRAIPKTVMKEIKKRKIKIF